MYGALTTRRLFAVITLLSLALLFVGAACDSSSDDPDEAEATAAATAAPTASPTQTSTPTATPVPPTEAPPATLTSAAGVLVVRVVDGDTIEIEGGERVRYIGIDTPESTIEHECFGSEASRRNAELVGGKVVQLERDVSERDRFDRLLRYIWLDGVLINEVLVREGYAVSSTYPPDVKYQDRFLAAQAEARNAGAGLWSSCGEDSPPIAPPPSGGGCDASYPDVCIPQYPPDLDCGQISHRRFRVLSPDPHGFDGDYDGVGCVSG